MHYRQQCLSSALQQLAVLPVGFLQFLYQFFHVVLAFAHSLCKLSHKKEHDGKNWDERTEHTYIIIRISALDVPYLLLTLGYAVVHLCINNGYHILQMLVDDLVSYSQTVEDAANPKALLLVLCQNVVVQGGQHLRGLVGAWLDNGSVCILVLLPKQAFPKATFLLWLLLLCLCKLLVFRLALLYNLQRSTSQRMVPFTM